MKKTYGLFLLLIAWCKVSCDKEESECSEMSSYCNEAGILVECRCVDGHCNEEADDRVFKWKEHDCNPFQCVETNGHAQCDMTCTQGDPDFCIDEIRPAKCQETSLPGWYKFHNLEVCEMYTSTSRCIISNGVAGCSCQKGETGLCYMGTPYNCVETDTPNVYTWQHGPSCAHFYEPSRECAVSNGEAICAEK